MRGGGGAGAGAGGGAEAAPALPVSSHRLAQGREAFVTFKAVSVLKAETRCWGLISLLN